MKRKTKEATSKIYTYGLHPPKVGALLVEEQLRLGARYYNNLVEIERSRRAACEAYLTSQFPDLAEASAKAEGLKAEIAEISKRVADEKMAARSKRRSTPSGSELADKRRDAKAAWAIVKTLKKKAYEESKVKTKEISAQHHELAKKARTTSGLYHGTYKLIDRAMEQVRQSRTPPSFKRWTGEGRIGVHYSGGVPHHKLADGTDTQIKISDRDVSKLSRKTLHFRVKSDDKHKPVWAVFDAIVHRPLPDEARVKDAWIKIRNRGWRKEYELQLSIEIPSAAKQCSGSGAVGLDLGWRSMEPDSIRAGYIVDGAGRGEQILVPETVVGQWKHAEALQSLRDKNFNVIKGELVAWLRVATENAVALPEWLSEVAQHLHLWRSSSRLAWHIKRWERERFAGDEVILPVLAAWRTRDNHLSQWSVDDRRKALNRRKDFYRKLCFGLAQKYSEIYIEDFDLRKMSRRPLPEHPESHQKELARAKKYKSSPSELRNVLKSTCSAYGVHLVKVPCEYTTLTCHLCGHCEEWDAAPAIKHTCSKCGKTWDQDLNAAYNILKLGSSGSMVLRSEKPLADNETTDLEGEVYSPSHEEQVDNSL